MTSSTRTVKAQVKHGLEMERQLAQQTERDRRERRKARARLARSLLFRYRAQLAPIGLLAVLWAAGAAVSGQPVGRAVVVGLAACGLAAWRLRGRLTRRAERCYATACCTGLLAWLLAAAVLGVGTVDLAGVAAWAIAAGVWWRHHTVRDVADPPATDLATWWTNTAESFAGSWPESKVVDQRPVDNGTALEIALPPGKLTTTDALGRAERIASAREGSLSTTLVEPTATRNASRFRLTLLRESQTERVQHWPGPQLDTATGLAPAGPYADAGLACVQWWRAGSGPKHWLITGSTESGKSRCIDWMLAESAHSGLIATWLGDPQGGQSLPAWRERVHRFEDTPEAIVTMLDDAVAEMTARSRALSRQAWTDEHGNTWTGRDHFDPTPDLPILQVVVDEAQDILEHGSRAVKLCERIARKGRKAGVRLVLATHVPSVDQLGGSMTLRAQVASGNVITLRTAERVSKNMVLPSRFAVDPYDLPTETEAGETTAGTAFIYGPSARPVPMRNYLIADVFKVAAECPVIPLRLLSQPTETPLADEAPENVPADMPPPGGSTVAAILALPWHQQPAWTRAQIHDGVRTAGHDVGLSAVQKACAELVEQQRLERAAHGTYQLTA